MQSFLNQRFDRFTIKMKILCHLRRNFLKNFEIFAIVVQIFEGPDCLLRRFIGRYSGVVENLDAFLHIFASHPGGENQVGFVCKRFHQRLCDIGRIRHCLGVENHQQSIHFIRFQAFHGVGIAFGGCITQNIDGISATPVGR